MMKQPTPIWKAGDKYNELKTFGLEVNNIFIHVVVENIVIVNM